MLTLFASTPVGCPGVVIRGGFQDQTRSLMPGQAFVFVFVTLEEQHVFRTMPAGYKNAIWVLGTYVQ